ncbi:MAG: hypothetical protein JNL74_13760, partial [Fibrobacteres bacterium]|nr:hypothetical protein [Fibrobacterota bacterium]
DKSSELMAGIHDSLCINLEDQVLVVKVDDDINVVKFQDAFRTEFKNDENFICKLKSDLRSELGYIKKMTIHNEYPLDNEDTAYCLDTNYYVLDIFALTVAQGIGYSLRSFSVFPGKLCIVSCIAELRRNDNEEPIWRIRLKGESGISSNYYAKDGISILNASKNCMVKLAEFVKIGNETKKSIHSF